MLESTHSTTCFTSFQFHSHPFNETAFALHHQLLPEKTAELVGLFRESEKLNLPLFQSRSSDDLINHSLNLSRSLYPAISIKNTNWVLYRSVVGMSSSIYQLSLASEPGSQIMLSQWLQRQVLQLFAIALPLVESCDRVIPD
jgi:hypothetical protein